MKERHQQVDWSLDFYHRNRVHKNASVEDMDASFLTWSSSYH